MEGMIIQTSYFLGGRGCYCDPYKSDMGYNHTFSVRIVNIVSIIVVIVKKYCKYCHYY